MTRRPDSQLSSALLCVFLFLLSLSTMNGTTAQTTRHRSKKGGHMLQLTSSAFQPEGNIPRQFTCEGDDVSPELKWTNAPSGTKSFALIVHDPDAPRSGGFPHWIAYNIPENVAQIPQGAPKGDKLSVGG